ncbi:MAG: SelB C-terminal domain-containing protein, partial [Acidimicrobiia bacterium]|nr:SelB C-terminal domain-containing protein [Acidimicrobiia bacterium]
IDRGIVALTRMDLVDADTAEIAQLDVSEHLAGLSLEGWPIFPVAAPTGLGIDALKTALADAVTETTATTSGRPRLWVDRTFTISGAGTVVTGTLLGGELTSGSEVVSLPGGDRWRIRQVQSHEADREVAEPGTRVALNLAGADRDALQRGTLLGLPGHWRETERFVASVRSVRSHPEPPADRGAYRIHIGSGSQPARLRMLRDDIALVTPAHPVPVTAGDRLIIRDVGRRAVIAGGAVLDPRPGPGPIDDVYLNTLTEADSASDVAAAFLTRRRVASRDELMADAGATPDSAIEAGDWLVDPQTAAALTDELHESVASFHADNPRRAGLPAATAASSLSIDPGILTALVDRDERMVLENGSIRLGTHADPWDADAEATWSRVAAELRASLAVPRASSLNIDPELLRLVIRSGRAVEIDADVVFLPEQLEEIEAAARELAVSGFTVSQLRDHLGVSRRHAVPIVEWLDATGVTRRSGDTRVLR